MPFGIMGRVGRWMTLNSGWGIPNGKGQIFCLEEGTKQHNVTYRKSVAMQCRCSVPAAEWLDSSAVSIAQLVALVADESILCMRSGDTVLPKLLWGFLLLDY